MKIVGQIQKGYVYKRVAIAENYIHL